MEYGAAYARASRAVDDDTVSAVSGSESRHQSQYQPYRPADHSKSSSADTTRRSLSWHVSPVELQQSLPPEPPLSQPSPSPHMRPSIFGSRDVLDTPYQEPVAWANSTQFGPSSTIQEAYKPPAIGASFVVTESSPPQDPRRYFRHPRHILEPWKPGFWKRFPLLGFGAMFLILLLTGASAGILLASNGMSVEDWKFGRDNAQPYVYISIFEMVMNFLILFALADGMVVRFWRQLLHGTTLSCIHDTYESVHLWPAVKRLVRLRCNAVAVACVLTAVSFVRGPLFHRALTIADAATTADGNIELQMASFPIVQYFQSNDSDPRNQNGVTASFSKVLRDLGAGAPLPYAPSLHSCGDYCTGIVKGFSFKTDCSSSTRSFNLDSLPNDCKACQDPQCVNRCRSLQQNSFNPTFFSISYKQENDSLILTSIHKDTNSCQGDVHIQTCTLTQVASDYPIVINNGTIDRLSSDPKARVYDEQLPVDRQVMEKWWPLAFETLFPPLSVNVTPASDFSHLVYNKCVAPSQASGADQSRSPSSCLNTSALAPGLLATDPSIIYATPNQAPAGQDPLCGLTWRDPMQPMLSAMQSLAFRTTVDMAASDGSVYAPAITGAALASLRKDWHQSVAVRGQRASPTYHTSHVLVAMGILLTAVGVGAVLPLYHGFWELGRRVTLDPLEVARAFGAPVLEGLDGNATPEMVTVERGGMGVRYGAVERYGEEKKLRVEETSRATVRVPWQGEIFG